MRKKYNTPHRSRVVKTRLSEDEYADFTARLAPYGISQSEFLRQAIRRATIRPVVHVSSVNDELLSAVGKLTAEYGRIGGNLNQIARYLNEYGVPYNTLSGEVRAAISDLAVLKYEVLKKVGDAVGNTQAYQPSPNQTTINNLTESQTKGVSGGPSAPYGRYGNIFLSQTEYDELQAEYPDRLERFIEEMSRYLAANGKSYQNYAAALRIWAGNDKKEAPKKGIPDYSCKEGESL